jgi:phosphatidylserine/phosphatidylglycerophosphate/cardiolipin synthase-like enzyme
VPLTLGNKLILLENGAQTYNAMLAAIRSAHSSINIQMFIFSDGQVGRTFAEALIDRQRHGVQVNRDFLMLFEARDNLLALARRDRTMRSDEARS